MKHINDMKMTDLKNKANRFSKVDIAAVVLFVCIAVYYFFYARRGIQSVDEAFYYTIPHRLMQGDRLFVDEWHLSQLSGLLQYIPFRLLYLLIGSTEGIILSLRYLYGTIKLIFYWYIYIRLREYGVAGLVAVTIYMFFEPYGYFTLNYYNMGIMASLIVCMILFIRKKNNPLIWFFCGIVFACGVLAQPYTLLIYIVFVVICGVNILGKKTERESFGVKSFVFVTLGAVTVFTVFCIVLFSQSDIKTLTATVPELLTDAEYELSFRLENYFEVSRLVGAAKCVGYVICLLYVFLLIGILICRRRKINARLPLTFAACLLFAAAVISIYVQGLKNAPLGILVVQELPLYFFGIVCYLLTEKKDRRMLAFWSYHFIFSLIVFCESDIAVGIGAPGACIASVILFSLLAAEIRAEQSTGKTGEKSRKKARLRKNDRVAVRAASFGIAAAIAAGAFSVFAFIVFSNCWHFSETFYSGSKEPLDTVLTEGPMKGIYTCSSTASRYTDAIEDLKKIKETTDGAVYIANAAPAFYLYLDRPYSTYAAYYVPADSETRMLRWWELHKDKLPEIIYIPKFNCESYIIDEEDALRKLDFIKSIWKNSESIESSVGITVKVKK